jgi:hypothetical protein
MEYLLIRGSILIAIILLTAIIIKIINYNIDFNIILNNVCLTYILIIMLNSIC